MGLSNHIRPTFVFCRPFIVTAANLLIHDVDGSSGLAFWPQCFFASGAHIYLMVVTGLTYGRGSEIFWDAGNKWDNQVDGVLKNRRKDPLFSRPERQLGSSRLFRGRFDRIALKVPKMVTPHVADPVVTANGDIWRRRVVTRDKQVKQRS
jgi:hypothetical protein